MTALARDHGVSRATGYRYLDGVIEVLADQAPDLHDALEKAKTDGLTYVILDGKIFSADHCGEKPMSVKGKLIDLWYSGNAHEHGGNVQAISGPDGFPLWISDVEPGSVHDLTVAQEHVLGPVLGRIPTRPARAGRRRLRGHGYWRAHPDQTTRR